MGKDDAAAWRAWMGQRYRERVRFLTKETAARRTWEEAVTEWFLLHGAPDVAICAGCGTPIGRDFIEMYGHRIHADARWMDCQIAFGDRWRGRAETALIAMGLKKPGGSDG
jgi:hypothetical protein